MAKMNADLRRALAQAGAVFAPLEPAETGIEIVQTLGAYELEYAAIRRAYTR